jgi:hypothetical protein
MESVASGQVSAWPHRLARFTGPETRLDNLRQLTIIRLRPVISSSGRG